MTVFIRIASPILIIISLGYILCKISEEHDKELLNNLKADKVILRLPKAYMVVGFCCVIVISAFILAMLLWPNGTESVWTIAVFSFFILLGCAIILKTKIWRIELFRSEDYFIVRDSPRKTYCISYRDCIRYRIYANSLRLETPKKRFRIDTYAVNFEFLLSMLKQHSVEDYTKR